MNETPDRAHGELRGGYAPRSTLRQGRFGRMFDNLPPAPCDDAQLVELADSMHEPPQPPPAPTDPYGRQTQSPDGGLLADNPAVPAGYTYLGQFIDHEMTFDPASRLQQVADPDALTDFRTPRLDLDSVYGSGPADQPYLYDESGAKFLIESVDGDPAQPDLPRNSLGRALIGDPRNDVNVIVSQLHVVFVRAHNKLVDLAVAEGIPAADAFDEARRELTWTYQRIVLEDYLPTICGQVVVDDVYRREGESYWVGVATPTETKLPVVRRLFYRWRYDPYMPVEFSGAIFRFGHSQIRSEYRLNEPLGPKPLFDPAGGESLLGLRRRASGWTIDWNGFFVVDGSAPQLSRRIDTNIVDPMLQLPVSIAVDPSSIALRNLLRGCTYQLPAGQSVAQAMGVDVLTPDEIGSTGAPASLVAHTPLWYYALAEAEVRESGEHLGPVGGRILTEVLAGLIDGDRNSFLNVNPRWQPVHIPLAGANATMAELIKFVAS